MRSASPFSNAAGSKCRRTLRKMSRELEVLGCTSTPPLSMRVMSSSSENRPSSASTDSLMLLTSCATSGSWARCAQRLGEQAHRVQRLAQVVAGGGEELRLGAVGDLGLAPRRVGRPPSRRAAGPRAPRCAASGRRRAANALAVVAAEQHRHAHRQRHHAGQLPAERACREGDARDRRREDTKHEDDEQAVLRRRGSAPRRRRRCRRRGRSAIWCGPLPRPRRTRPAMPHSAPEASTPACQARRRRSQRRPSSAARAGAKRMREPRRRSSQTIAKPGPRRRAATRGATPAEDHLDDDRADQRGRRATSG